METKSLYIWSEDLISRHEMLNILNMSLVFKFGFFKAVMNK